MTLTIDKLNNSLTNIHDYNIDIETRQIFVAPESDDEEDNVNYKMAEKFVKNITFLDNISDENITIHMITGGGSWEYGLAMYDAIKNSRSFVTTISYAEASSMSSIIIQAADERILMPNTIVMVHYVSLGTTGSTKDVMSEADIAKICHKKMLEIYAERCVSGTIFKEKGYSESSVIKFIENKLDKTGNWYMTAEEAIEYGFADKILSPI